MSKSRRVDEPIWVFWWTGEETAPEIVKACIKSIRRNANGHRVIFLSKDNLHDYVTLPDFIEKKHNDGNIGHAHYSDIVRISLLAEYGGVWIDSTVLFRNLYLTICLVNVFTRQDQLITKHFIFRVQDG